MNDTDQDEESSRIETIKRQLESSDVEMQRKAVATLEKIAGDEPKLLLQNDMVLRTAFDSDDSRTIEGAVRAASKVISSNPSEGRIFAPLIAESVNEVSSTNAQLSGIRALALLANEAGVEISAYDGILAELLKKGNILIRKKVAQNFSAVVGAQSDEFPQLVEAYLDALSDPRKDVRETALVTLALIAATDPGNVDDWSAVLDTVDDMDEVPSDNSRAAEAKEIIGHVSARQSERGDE